MSAQGRPKREYRSAQHEGRSTRSLVAIEVHDVAPATWPDCQRLIGMLERLGAPPLSLLVVPWYHRGVAIDRAPQFVRAIDDRVASGDEAVLHGYVHLDEAPRPRSLRGFVERRLLTRSEGEFAALDLHESSRRISDAWAMWQRVGWRASGFVPPAWLLGPAARATLATDNDRFMYVALRRGVWRLPDWRCVSTDLLCYSPTSASRRLMSRAMIALATARASRHRLLRIALHPQDAGNSRVLAHWQRIIAAALVEREAVTTQVALAKLGLRPLSEGPLRLVNASSQPRSGTSRMHRRRRSASL